MPCPTGVRTLDQVLDSKARAQTSTPPASAFDRMYPDAKLIGRSL